jgi:hypothetical protein
MFYIRPIQHLFGDTIFWLQRRRGGERAELQPHTSEKLWSTQSFLDPKSTQWYWWNHDLGCLQQLLYHIPYFKLHSANNVIYNIVSRILHDPPKSALNYRVFKGAPKHLFT